MASIRRKIIGTAALIGAVCLPMAGTARTPSPTPGARDGEAPKARPRNVIFIILDDLRYDGMGFLQPQIRTPNIDKLAKSGVE